MNQLTRPSTLIICTLIHNPFSPPFVYPNLIVEHTRKNEIPDCLHFYALMKERDRHVLRRKRHKLCV